MEFQARCYGQSKRAARTSVERVSEILGCSYLLDWQVGRLSGGRRRIVEIGLALVGSPAVIILDEPTLGLDPAVRVSLWQAIQSARDSTMSAFLITTHYIKEVADYLSAVKILDHGREVASGNPSALEGNFRLLLIIGGDHGGSFALGSLLRIVAACPGEMARCCSSSQLWCQANAH